MYIGRIRPVETKTLELPADVDDVTAAMTPMLPAGWEILSPKDRTIVRVDGVQEIEAEDMATLEGKVPEGWQLLSVRRG